MRLAGVEVDKAVDLSSSMQQTLAGGDVALSTAAVPGLLQPTAEFGRVSGIQIRTGSIADKEGDVAVALMGTSPYEVPFSAIAFRSLVDGLGLPARLQLAACNASLVGIASAENGATCRSLTSLYKPHEEGMPLCDAETFEIDCVGSEAAASLAPCFGLGIVRAIDVNAEKLYIITPESPALFPPGKIALYRGNLQIPTLLLYAPNLPCYPYLNGETAGEGSGVMKARNNVKRRSQHNKD